MSEQQANEQQGKPRLLIVDDVPTNIRVLGPVLRDEDYQVYVARDGYQALKMVDEVCPDLILLDIMMPGLDGFDTCEELKKKPETRDIPIIFLTARIEEQDVVRGFNAGAVDYVTKPFNSRILLARVKTHLTLRKQAQKLQSLATKDGLTLLANRRRFDEFLQQEWRRSQRVQIPLSLIMLDIDYFKLYNDTYGHLQGDEALRKVAEVIGKAAQRPCDLAARYGGEEFALILSDTEAEGALRIAEKVRTQVIELMIPHSTSPVIEQITLSLGIATFMPETMGSDATEQTLIEIADSQLYVSKASGRNRVSAISPLEMEMKE